MSNSTTSRIVIFDPDEEGLRKALVGRKLSPELTKFLNDLLKRKKWARKIHIPSARDDLAVVLVFATTLKPGGLEILSELHVYFAGQVIVEQWEIAGENDHIHLLPKEAFRALDIAKVHVDGSLVHVEFSIPLPDGHSERRVKTFDFSTNQQD